MLKKIFFSFALISAYCAHGQAHWQQEANFRIDVSLNDVENSLDGFMRLQYVNHSPDTLHFIWFHLWPNAYKNDRTAFSDQLLENNRTDFYFSDKEKKGYINHLDFRVNGTIATIEDHPEFIDIIKVILPEPLAPGNEIAITTPFHEKLPFNFSRGGHINQSYQITQWYPKPAVYDQKGWHLLPYLDQGEFYSEFGNYDVRITLPKNYIVAATGELQDEEEKKWMINKNKDIQKIENQPKASNIKPKKSFTTGHQAIHPNKSTINPAIPSETKTLAYEQNNIHDFAWFADKHFIVDHDTIQLTTGRVIDAYSFYLPNEKLTWRNSIQYIKDAIHFHSSLIGDYPFNTVSVAEASLSFEGGMEYPTITCISPIKEEKELDQVIGHEVGHNWFYATLASNERRYPWMDEGMNTYYDNRYEKWKYESPKNPAGAKNKSKWLTNKLPEDENKLIMDVLIKEKLDQPISTSSENFTEINYNVIAYTKTAFWMKQLEDSLGTSLFDSCMHVYFREWQFKHPYPEDFLSVMEKTSGKDLHPQFALLDKKGPLNADRPTKKIKPAFLFSLNHTDQFTYINIGPGIGYNMYDKFMLGAVLNNYNLPQNNFQFLVIPLYATGSKHVNGITDLNYSWHPENYFQKISIGVNGMAFSTNAATDTNNNKIVERFSKIVPYIRLSFKNKSSRSSAEKWIDFRAYIITEKSFGDYSLSSIDSNIHPTTLKNNNRYLNQLSFNISDYRALYPYNLQLQLQQSDLFYRINLTGNYFFNYAHGGGMNVRFFAAKFGVWGNNHSIDVTRYEPKLLGVTGEEDYTYSNYFLGRTASYAIEGSSIKNGGMAAQQIMIRDGGLKLRVDQYDFVQGRSANWVSALNFNTTLPNHLFPVRLPIKIFFDVGTYAEAWKDNAPTSKFLYVGGLQLSLIHDLLNIYVPIVYSSDFRNVLKTIPEQNTFWKKITFSIDIQNLDYKKAIRNILSQR